MSHSLRCLVKMVVFPIPVKKTHMEEADQCRVVEWHRVPIHKGKQHPHVHCPQGIIVVEVLERVTIPLLMMSCCIWILVSGNDKVRENTLQNLYWLMISRLSLRRDQVLGLTQYQEGYSDKGLALATGWRQLSQWVILSQPLGVCYNSFIKLHLFLAKSQACPPSCDTKTDQLHPTLISTRYPFPLSYLIFISFSYHFHLILSSLSEHRKMNSIRQKTI